MFAVSGAERNIPEQSGAPSTFYARVTDVILDSDHPEYDNYGKAISINGIFFRPLGQPTTEDSPNRLFAAQGNSTFKSVPLKNEIVMIVQMPSNDREFDSEKLISYWTKVVPMWNHPHHNAYPDVTQYNDQADNADLGSDFEEIGATNPIALSPGDTIIEGRHGNHIKLGGTTHSTNDISTEEDNGKPYIFISNGQVETEDGIDTVKEDINEDSTSIYLTQDHQIPLTQANEKRDSYKEAPETAEAYKGAQTIINSNRIFLNAKEDAVLISSLESVGINTKVVAIDGEDYVGIDADKIYLGKIALNREDEPVLLGQSTTEWLEDLHAILETVVKTMSTLPGAPPAAVGKMIAIGATLRPQMVPLKKRLELLKSKKVFTE